MPFPPCPPLWRVWAWPGAPRPAPVPVAVSDPWPQGLEIVAEGIFVDVESFVRSLMQGVVPEKDQMWSFSIMSAGRFDEDPGSDRCAAAHSGVPAPLGCKGRKDP